MKKTMMVAAALAALAQSASALSYPHPQDPCKGGKQPIFDGGTVKCLPDQLPRPLPWPGTIYNPERPEQDLFHERLGALGSKLTKAAAAAFDGGSHGGILDAGGTSAGSVAQAGMSLPVPAFVKAHTNPEVPVPVTGKPRPQFLPVACGDGQSGCASEWGKFGEDLLKPFTDPIDRYGDRLNDEGERRAREGREAQERAERQYPRR